MKRKAYSYIRMSTEVQLKGDSLRRQKEMSSTYARQHDLELVESIDGDLLQDIGVSGFRGRNIEKGMLGNFIAAIDAGKIPQDSILLIENLDRLSRDALASSFPMFLHIITSGIEIITLSDGRRYSQQDIDDNPYGLFSSLAVMIRANDESKLKSSRLRSVWQNKRNDLGKKKLTSICPAWLLYDKGSDSFLFDEEKVKMVRLIFTMCANTCGLHGIVKYLNENKIPVFGRGKLWYRSYLNKIIRNRSVLGEFSPGTRVGEKQVPTGVVVPDYYPRIIEDALFASANLAIERRKNETKGRKAGFQNLFTGLGYCGTCGSKMILRNRGSLPKGGRYLCCSAAASGGDCDMYEWRLDSVEKVLLSHLREVDFSALNPVQENPLAEIDLKIAECEYSLKELSVQEKRAYDKLLYEDLLPEVEANFMGRISEFVSEKKQLTLLLESLQNEKNEYINSASVMQNNIIASLIDRLKENPDDYYFRSMVNEALRKAIQKIEFTKEPYFFEPWAYTEESVEVKIFRSSALKRKKIPLDELVNRHGFERLCRACAMTMKVFYKGGGIRITTLGSGASYHQNFKLSATNDGIEK